jgi:thiamine pyrophosphokinase
MTLVVANGEWPNEDLMQTLIENSEFVIALDGASDRFDAWDVVVGDMDSVEDSSRFEADNNQENSDLAKALLKYDVDAVVGIGGGRLDHRLGAFTALFETESDAILYFEGWRACRVGVLGLEIELESGTSCSLMALGKVTNVSIKGTEFELENQDLFTGTRGIGNKAISNEILISHDGGDLLFIWEANEL